MVIAIPTNNRKRIAPHIALAKEFLIVDLESGEERVLENPIMKEIRERGLEIPKEEPRGLGAGRIIPPLLKEAGVDALVATEVSPRMKANLGYYRIGVVEVEEKEIPQLLERFKAQLPEVEIVEPVEGVVRPGVATNWPSGGRGLGVGLGRGFGRGLGRGFGRGFGRDLAVEGGVYRYRRVPRWWEQEQWQLDRGVEVTEVGGRGRPGFGRGFGRRVGGGFGYRQQIGRGFGRGLGRGFGRGLGRGVGRGLGRRWWEEEE